MVSRLRSLPFAGPSARAKLEPGGIYRITSRNLLVGAFDGDRGMIGLRHKFDERYLTTEYLADGGAFGTVLAAHEQLGQVPDDIPLKEVLGSECLGCGKRAWWTGPPAPAPWVCEGGCEKPRPVAVSNQALVELLVPFDEQIRFERRPPQ